MVFESCNQTAPGEERPQRHRPTPCYRFRVINLHYCMLDHLNFRGDPKRGYPSSGKTPMLGRAVMSSCSLPYCSDVWKALIGTCSNSTCSSTLAFPVVSAPSVRESIAWNPVMFGRLVGSLCRGGLPLLSIDDQNEVWNDRDCFGNSVRSGFHTDVLVCSPCEYPRSMSPTVSAWLFAQLEVEISVVTPKVDFPGSETEGMGNRDRPLRWRCEVGVRPRSGPGMLRLRERFVRNVWKRLGRTITRSWRTAGSDAQTMPAASSAPVQMTTLV